MLQALDIRSSVAGPLVPAAFAAFLTLVPAQAMAFRITSPTDGATITSGRSVPVEVDAGHEAGLVEVRYFWYPEQADALVEQADDRSGKSSSAQPPTPDLQKDSISGVPVVALPAFTSTIDQRPPYGGPVPIPPEAIGRMRLLASADISQGRLGRKTVFDEVIVTIQPSADLLAIDFETDKPLQLGRSGQSSAYGHVDSLGKIFELPVVGEFSDGVTRPLASPGSGTTYRSSDEQILKVLPDGLLQIVGNGKATITVANRGKQATLDVRVEVNPEPNEPPLADAGTAKTVKSGTKVRLNGLQSRDPEGEALFYNWSQVRGAKVSMLDVNMPEPSFTAPYVSQTRRYRFKLRVTDRKGADSLPAYVDVTVEP